MRKLTCLISTLTAATLALSLLSGCAARRAEARAKLPIAASICLQVEEVKEPEKGLLLRKAKALLVEREFRVVEADCDLKVGYTALDQGQWEMMATSLLGLRSRSAYRVEGLVTVWERSGALVVQDQPINLRDYSSKSDILEALAWEFIEYVPDNYRPK